MSEHLALAPIDLERENILESDEDKTTEEAYQNSFFCRIKQGAARLALAATTLIGGATIAVGTETVQPEVAEASNDNYPWDDAVCKATGRVEGACPGYDWRVGGDEFDQWGYSYRNCTSYAAWRVNKEFGKSISYWGNAENWDSAARTAGYAVDINGPEAGDVAVWDPRYERDPGHVAFVESVNPDGSVNIAEYNQAGTGRGSLRSNVRANHYIDINGEGNIWNGSSSGGNSDPARDPRINPAAGLVPFAAIREGEEFVSQEGHVYTKVGGAAWWISHRDQWVPARDEEIWGGRPVEPVATAEVHDHEVGRGGPGAHPPGFGVAVYERGNPQQWYFVPGAGRAYPIGPGELSDLGVYNNAHQIPAGLLDQFKYGDIRLPNGTVYRAAGGVAVRHQVDNAAGGRYSYSVGSDTALSCLELAQGKRVVILPQSAIPYAEANVQVLNQPTACAFPPGMVLRGPGGQEQWRITGDGSSQPYMRHLFISPLQTYLHTSGRPDIREMRSVGAINGVPEGPNMGLPNGQFFRDTGTGQVYVSRNGVIESVAAPDMITCLPVPNKSIIDVPSQAMVAMPVSGTAQCNYEGRIIYGPNGQQFFIQDGRRQAVGTQALSACLGVRRGAGGPIAVSASTINDYVPDVVGAYCPYELESGLNFVREQGSPHVMLVDRTNPGVLRHVGSLCVVDPDTTIHKRFRVHQVPPGELAGHTIGPDWFATDQTCQTLSD